MRKLITVAALVATSNLAFAANAPLGGTCGADHAVAFDNQKGLLLSCDHGKYRAATNADLMALAGLHRSPSQPAAADDELFRTAHVLQQGALLVADGCLYATTKQKGEWKLLRVKANGKPVCESR